MAANALAVTSDAAVLSSALAVEAVRNVSETARAGRRCVTRNVEIRVALERNFVSNANHIDTATGESDLQLVDGRVYSIGREQRHVDAALPPAGVKVRV